MARIAELLQAIRRRPGVYIGWPSLSRLAGYLHGYHHAVCEICGDHDEPFFITFQEWIERRLQVKAEFWDNALLQRTASEAEAFELFWVLFDEYLAEQAGHAPQGNGADAARVSSKKESQP